MPPDGPRQILIELEQQRVWPQPVPEADNFKAVDAALESGDESMTTIAQSRSMRSRPAVQLAGPADEYSVSYHLVGRLIQITLAVYLLPALFFVLVVGGAGILVLKTGRVFWDLLDR